MPGLLNYTTTISADKTIGEMQQMLRKAGATSVAVHYGDDQRAGGLSFRVVTKHGLRDFTLPVDITPVQRILADQRSRPYSKTERLQLVADQAERTAWRVARSWLEAQLALIQIGMATLDQVMLPYLHVGPDLTLYAAYQDQQDVLALTAGGE